MQDSPIRNGVLNYKLENFEGPLDLLLSLVLKNKMSLTDIRLSVVIDQYLDYMNEYSINDPDTDSEFIEMAARLLHIKTYQLLPRSEETEKLEEELVGELIEYSNCKLAAAEFRDMMNRTKVYVREPMKVEFPATYRLNHHPYILLDSYLALMDRGELGQEEAISKFEKIVVTRKTNVASGILNILRKIKRGILKNAAQLFTKKSPKGEMVTTFLGLLELIRAGRITVKKTGEIFERSDKDKSRVHENGGGH